MLELKEFAELVAHLRTAQKEYFRTRSEAALATAKRLEKTVDNRLAEIFAADSQSTLFQEKQ